MRSNHWGLGLFAAAVSLSAAVGVDAAQQTFSGTGGAIADAVAVVVDGTPRMDAGVTNFSITIGGTGGVVTGIDSLTLTNLTHTYVGDLTVFLIGPTSLPDDGLIYATLTSPPSDRSNNANGTYTFVVNPALQTIDEATAGLDDEANLSSGSYALSDYGGEDKDGNEVNGPRTDYSPLIGQPLDGVWTLQIQDANEGDVGSLGSWSFDVTYAVPEPGTLALLAAGPLALLRRRRVA